MSMELIRTYVYRLLKKGTKPNTILLGIIVVSVLLTAIGIF